MHANLSNRPFGKSRLLAYGRCTSKVELEEIRKQHGVSAGNCIMDSGYMANDVYPVPDDGGTA